MSGARSAAARGRGRSHQLGTSSDSIRRSPNRPFAERAFAQYNSTTARLDFSVRLRYAFADATDVARDGREAGDGQPEAGRDTRAG
jgi:hypothetical protein